LLRKRLSFRSEDEESSDEIFTPVPPAVLKSKQKCLQVEEINISVEELPEKIQKRVIDYYAVRASGLSPIYGKYSYLKIHFELMRSRKYILNHKIV